MLSNNQLNVIVQTVVPGYRMEVFNELANRLGPKFKVLGGQEFFEQSVHSSQDAQNKSWFRRVENRFLLRRKLLWQAGVLRPAVSSHYCILEFNPRIVSSLVVIVVRRIFRRQTFVWGHVSSRDGVMRWPRKVLLPLVAGMVCYTEAERQSLPDRVRRKSVVAPNALYRRAVIEEAISHSKAFTERRDFIYVGRLSADKEVLLLIDAFAEACKTASFKGDLVVVGDGPLRQVFQEQVADAGLSARVKVVRPVYDSKQLAALYSAAVAALSPGYLGLSLIQAMSFGVPLIAADSANHAPEQTLASEHDAVFWFRHGSSSSLASFIKRLALLPKQNTTTLQAKILNHHTVEDMVAGLESAMSPPEPIDVQVCIVATRQTGRADGAKAVSAGMVEALGKDAQIAGIDLAHGSETRLGRAYYRSIAEAKIVRELIRWRNTDSVLYREMSGESGRPFDLATVLVAAVVRTPAFLHLHSWRVATEANRTTSLLLSRRFGAHVIVLSDTMRDVLIRTYDLSTDRVSACNNRGLLPVMPKVRRLQSRPDAIRIGFIGNLYPEKGLDTFLELAETEPNGILLKLAGPTTGAESELLVDRFKRLAKCTYVGAVSGVKKDRFFSNCDIVLFPSRYEHEAWPIVIEEALN